MSSGLINTVYLNFSETLAPKMFKALSFIIEAFAIGFKVMAHLLLIQTIVLPCVVTGSVRLNWRWWEMFKKREETLCNITIERKGGNGWKGQQTKGLPTRELDNWKAGVKYRGGGGARLKLVNEAHSTRVVHFRTYYTWQNLGKQRVQNNLF